MCFFMKASKKVLAQLEIKYQVMDEVVRVLRLQKEADEWVVNGFTHPDTVVVANDQPSRLQLMNWGLIPSWAKDRTIQNNTLNARIETIAEKSSFRDSLNRRCLVFADGFYEWQWLDTKGREKQKYLVGLPDDVPFALAGLWNAWTDRQTGEILKTFTILTTQANELMSVIHNTKKRMPMLVANGDEWLLGGELRMANESLRAEKVAG